MATTRRAADALVDAMIDVGIDTVFSLSGNQIMPIYDACIDKSIRIVHARHEAAAVFMADAHAQLTGRPAVALVTAAPGFGNALGALYSAAMSESPVILISGDSPVAADGKGAFQEFDQVGAAGPFTLLSVRCTSGDSLASDFARCAQAASGVRHGPVHLAVPFDVVNAHVDAVANTPVTATVAPGPDALAPISRSDCKELLAALAESDRPIILVGPMLSRSRTGNLIEELGNACQAPVIAMESPRGLRDPSLGAFAQALTRADCVVLIGKRGDFTCGFLAESAIGPAKIFCVEGSPPVLQAIRQGADGRFSRGFCGAPLASMQLLREIASDAGAPAQPRRDAWMQHVGAALTCRELPAGLPAFVPQLQALQHWLDTQPEPILVVDGGEFGQWAQAMLSAPQRVINGASGAIGGSVAYALAARVARPDATVLALLGDGTAGFHIGEFDTAVRAQAPFVAVVGNDSCWNAERLIQIRDYGEERQIGCELNPQARYDQVVQALGGYGEQVESGESLVAAVERAQASGLPACIDWRIEGQGAPMFAQTAQ